MDLGSEIKSSKTRFINALEMQQHKTWGQIYKDIGAVQTVPTQFVKQNASKLGVSGKILDLGCGTGRNTKYLHEQGLDVVGVDRSEEAIRIAKLRAPEITFKVADARNLPFPDEEFSGVVCTHVIEHHVPEDIEKIISEISRVLKKKGLLLLSTISARDPALGTGKRVCDNTYVEIRQFLDGGELHHFFTRTELTGFLKKHFDILDIHHSTHTNYDQIDSEYHKLKIAHWNVIARKK